jgi:hypothetical protein
MEGIELEAALANAASICSWPAILRPMSRISRPSLLRRMRNCGR